MGTQNTKHLRDAITEFEQKIGTGATTPKALPSIVEDTKEESMDESNRKKNQRTFYHQSRVAMKSSRSSKENAVVTVKKAIAQAHREVSKRIEQSRSQSRSRSFNAPLQIQKNKLSTKDLGSGAAVVATSTFSQRRGSAQHMTRASKARLTVQSGAELTHSSSRISHRRSTTTNENMPHSMTYQIQPSFTEFSKTRHIDMHTTHGNLK